MINCEFSLSRLMCFSQLSSRINYQHQHLWRSLRGITGPFTILGQKQGYNHTDMFTGSQATKLASTRSMCSFQNCKDSSSGGGGGGAQGALAPPPPSRLRNAVFMLMNDGLEHQALSFLVELTSKSNKLRITESIINFLIA